MIVRALYFIYKYMKYHKILKKIGTQELLQILTASLGIPIKIDYVDRFYGIITSNSDDVDYIQNQVYKNLINIEHLLASTQLLDVLELKLRRINNNQFLLVLQFYFTTKMLQIVKWALLEICLILVGFFISICIL